MSDQIPCAVPWCLLPAAPEADRCLVHLKDPHYVPGLHLEDWEQVDLRKDCHACGGSGVCTCPSCQGRHNCGECDGTGTDEGFAGYRHKRTGELVDEYQLLQRLADESGMAKQWIRLPEDLR